MFIDVAAIMNIHPPNGTSLYKVYKKTLTFEIQISHDDGDHTCSAEIATPVKPETDRESGFILGRENFRI
jgi:hypothetical protein